MDNRDISLVLMDNFCKKKRAKGECSAVLIHLIKFFFCCNVGEQNEICQIKGENKTQTCLIVRKSTPKCVRPILEKREIFKKLENDQNIFFCAGIEASICLWLKLFILLSSRELKNSVWLVYLLNAEII